MATVNNIMDLLEAGVKAEGLRQRAISSNIANIETPDYRRVDVKFEELLAKALDSQGSGDLEDLTPELFEPKDTPVKGNGNDVSLEGEVGQMIKNSLRQRTYVRLLAKKYKQIEMAMEV